MLILIIKKKSSFLFFSFKNVMMTLNIPAKAGLHVVD